MHPRSSEIVPEISLPPCTVCVCDTRVQIRDYNVQCVSVIQRPRYGTVMYSLCMRYQDPVQDLCTLYSACL